MWYWGRIHTDIKTAPDPGPTPFLFSKNHRPTKGEPRRSHCPFSPGLGFDLGADQIEELLDEFGMGRPGRGSDKIAVGMGVGEGLVHVHPCGAAHFKIGTNRGIGGAGLER